MYRPRKTTLPLLGTTVALLVLIATLLACGPADESVQQEIGNLPVIAQEDPPAPAEDPTPTPEPAEQPAINEYPNLDETLKNVVRQYESEEKTETEAAALAPEHSGKMVLVQVDLTAAALTPVNTWMGLQSVDVRYAVSDYSPPFIYAFVRVSLLGELSQQTGVTLVRALVNFHGPDVTWELPIEKPAQSRDSSGEVVPELPPWLKGYPHPRSYYKLRGILPYLAEYDAKGTLTDAILEEEAIQCNIRLGRNIEVGVHVHDTGTDVADMVTWLRANATEVPDDPTLPGEGDLIFISALLPISQLTTAMDRPGIYRIRTYPCHFLAVEDEVEDLGTLLGPDFEGEGRMPRFTNLVESEGVALLTYSNK